VKTFLSDQETINVINIVQRVFSCGLGFPYLRVPLLLKEPLEEKNSEVTYVACSILCSFLCNIVFSFIAFTEIVDTDEN